MQQIIRTTHTIPTLVPQSFIPPQQILQGLLLTQVNNCNCNETIQNSHLQQKQYAQQKQEQKSIQNIQQSIINLQQTLDIMNHQVVQVQGLLSQRDTLYHQMDHLRAERQDIQDQIQNYQINVQKNVKIKANRGLKQMNERLRRRIKQVKQYIQKMDNQNMKIEQSMSTSYNYNSNNNNNPIFTSYTEYRGPNSPRWVDRISPQSHYNNNTYQRINRDYYDGLRKRLQVKQQQAWDRVKRQQQQIQNRNARSLMNFHNRTGGINSMYNNMRSGYLSPKYRAY